MQKLHNENQTKITRRSRGYLAQITINDLKMTMSESKVITIMSKIPDLVQPAPDQRDDSILLYHQVNRPLMNLILK